MKTIEFMGMPKSGKSTQLESLETILKQTNGKLVRIINEGARICPFDKNNRFEYNAWSFHTTINRIIETKHSNFDYLLIDRGIYDHIAFTCALGKSKEITAVQQITQLEYFKQFPYLEDSVLVFMVSPQEAMKREQKHYNLQGRVMNLPFLYRLYETYQQTIETIKQPIQLIDGSKEFSENRKDILDFITQTETS